MSEKVRTVLLADDHDILLDSLEKLISGEPDLKIIGKVNNGSELIERVALSKPDLCIVDLDMPVMNGMVASEKLLKTHEDIRIIILSMHSETSLMKNMIRMGIMGYLTKTTDREEFLFAVRQVLKGKKYFSNELLEATVHEKPTPGTNEALLKISQLSEREKEIAILVCQGLTNKEVGEKLFLSPKTIDNHRSNIMKKLEVHNVVELIRFCIKNHLVD